MENEKKKSKFWLGVMVGILGTASACFLAVYFVIGISNFSLKNVIQGPTRPNFLENVGDVNNGTDETAKLDMESILEKASVLEDVIDRYFLFDIDAEQLESGIYKGLMSGLNDPYTVYYTPEEYDELTEETEGVYCGIGVLVSQNIETKIITVLRVFPGSPAEEAGMKKGDVLYEVGEISALEEDFDVLVSQHIRGEEGTYVDLVVLRGNEEIPLHIERRMVESSTVEYQMMEDKTGYILVTQFEMVTSNQFKEAIEDLTEQGMERMVIDLRDNPGGIVDACVEMAAYLLPEDQYDGTIISIASKTGEEERYYCGNGKIYHETKQGQTAGSNYFMEDDHQVDMPIAILMNGNSASASEVFAGAMRDYKRATLVGTTSFGKGIVQSILPLGDGSAVKLTTAHYYTPAGTDLHKKGLSPDVEVELELDEDLIGQYDVPLERDNQVMKAVEALKQ